MFQHFLTTSWTTLYGWWDDGIKERKLSLRERKESTTTSYSYVHKKGGGRPYIPCVSTVIRSTHQCLRSLHYGLKAKGVSQKPDRHAKQETVLFWLPRKDKMCGQENAENGDRETSMLLFQYSRNQDYTS